MDGEAPSKEQLTAPGVCVCMYRWSIIDHGLGVNEDRGWQDRKLKLHIAHSGMLLT